MKTNNWEKAREIFGDALELAPENRAVFLDKMCADDKLLRREVESLLSSLNHAENFMETPAVAKVAEIIEGETKPLGRGKCFNHYEIIKQIGAGGMGEVYLAKDKKLDRKVAVKLLNESLAAHESNLQRFIREAKAASALNHPNILVIHEIGESEDAHYIVSEFIKGKTLREVLREKFIKLSEVLDISIQIANALAAAHEARLVHRDIKPENVMIRPDGFVKVLDFGLAKLVEQKTKSFLDLDAVTAHQTQTGKGIILGTVNYMSPEQAKAEKVDERTDIFSFGAVVYEMLSGQTPFAGETVSETFANLINVEPKPLSTDLPDELRRITLKTLRKNKDERYQTMKDVLTDLKELKENLKSDDKLEHSTSPEKGNSTVVLQATTGDANLQTDETAHGLGRMFKWLFLSEEKTNTISSPKTTKRRKGLIRGLKFLFRGLVFAVLSPILTQVLQVFNLIRFQYKNNLSFPDSTEFTDFVSYLLIVVQILLLLSYLLGIGLLLFGIARIFYALFEKESSKINSSLVERLIAAIIIIIILAVAIPNLIYNYREVNKARQLQQSSNGDKKSIAVLPLKPIGASNRDELYEIGIADSLITKLGAMKGFVVRPLSATRKYSDINQDPIAAGREQQVDYVLESNYQLAGGRIRITSQLFNVASGQIEETYKSEKDASNIFAAQDAIAGEVGNKLLALFATTEGSPLAKRGTTNEEAYRLYLQGRNLTARRSPADARKAIEYFEQAIRLDPNYALAYVGMAESYIAVSILGGGLPHEENKKAKAAVTKALELDNNLAEGYRVLAAIKHFYEWDFAGAENAWLRAAELEPHSVVGHPFSAGYLAYRGRFDEAIAKTEAALEIDPNSLGLQRDRGRYLYLARRYDEAIVQLKRVVEVDAGFLTTYSWLWQAYHLKGDHAGAYEWFLKYHQQRKVSPERIDLYQNAYRTSGWRGVLQKQVEIHMLDEQGDTGDHPTNYKVGLLSALLGEKDQAFEYLNKLFEQRNSQVIMLNVEPALDNLRGDPRFAELVRRVGLPQ